MGTSRYKRHFPTGLSKLLSIGVGVVIGIMMVSLFFGYNDLMQQSTTNNFLNYLIFIIYLLLFVYCLRQHFVYQTFRSLLYMLMFLLMALAYVFHKYVVALEGGLYNSGANTLIILLEWMLLVSIIFIMKPNKWIRRVVFIGYATIVIISLAHPYLNQYQLMNVQYKMVVLIYLILFVLVIRWYKVQREPLLVALNWVLFFFIACYSLFSLSALYTGRFTTIAIVCKLIGVICLIKVVLVYFKKLNTDMDDHAVTSELELLFEHSGDAIVVYREDLSIVRSNWGFKNMFGYNDHDELTVKSLIPDELMEEYCGLLQQLNNGVPVVNFQTKRRRKDASIIDISISTSMINRDGEILYASILRDITEQKQAEGELIKARQELEEAVELHNGIIFKVRKEKNHFIHPLIGGKLLRDMKITSHSLRGKELKDILSTNYSKQLESYYEKAWNGNEQVFQLRFRDDTFLLSLIPKFENGQVVEIIGTCSDITTAIKTEELLRKSEKLSVVGELAAGFAHEIRNPLTTIKGFLQLMQQQPVCINDQYLSIILNEIDHLEMITNEFMAVARPEAVQYQKENLYELIFKVNRFLKPQAILNNIDLQVEQEVETPYVYADRNQMKQVFINLYKNAIEAMENGGKIVTTIKMVNDQMVSITIKDQGCGIPAHLIDRLGEPFYTLKEKGTGLGLMVTKKIIDSHDGFIDIYSKEHVGTTVTITLPLFEEERSSGVQLADN